MKNFRAHYVSTTLDCAQIPENLDVDVLKNQLGELVIEFSSDEIEPTPPEFQNFTWEQVYPINY